MLVLCVFTITVTAQVGNTFNYQAVVRNETGELEVNQNVSFRISIINESESGTVLYTETHGVKTNAFGVVHLMIGAGTPTLGTFSGIDWTGSDKFMKIEMDINGGTAYVNIGTSQLLSVPFSAYSKNADVANLASNATNATNAVNATNATFATNSNHALKADTSTIAKQLDEDVLYFTQTDTLFAVKDRNGKIVFAVYPDGAEIFVDESAKGNVGGFAVTGRNPTKAGGNSILKVTADSTRIFVNDNVKGNVGGFAVTGRNPTKGTDDEYLVITPDSTRIYVNDAGKNKGGVGGFAVSGRTPTKSGSQFMSLTPDNYFIGHRAGESIQDGLYNIFLGYETGVLSTWGDGNTFIGYSAGHDNVDGQLNVFLGNLAGYSFNGSEDGEENIFIGSSAGRDCLTTANSIFIGTRSGLNCGAYYGNTFVGDRTASMGSAGDNNTLLGSAAGYSISGNENVMLGANAGIASTSGSTNTFVGYNSGHDNTSGSGNVFIGAYAGYTETGSNKLHIANNSSTSLITGDFLAEEVTINGDLYANSYNLSDIKLKENFKEIKSGLKIVSALAGYYFNWNDLAKSEFNYTDEQQIGIIAQDAEKVLPEIVTTNSKGYKAVDYSKLTPVLIEAVKEQQAKIDQLEKQNKDLLERLKKLEELIMK